MIRLRSLLGIGAAGVVLAVGAPAAEAQQDTAELARLRRQIEALSREVEALRLGSDVMPVADTSAHGFGPAASKIYKVQQGVSIGGYGEMLYENFAKERENDTPSNLRDQVDALRLIVYLGYRFTDKLLFNSEVEFEHASTDQGGSASVEFAYIDYLASDVLGVRGGMLLVPMGFINELHEPPVFLGTTRPMTETVIMPTTWRENGFGIFGDAGDFSYRAYVINGLDAVGNGPSRAGGFSAAGLRGGRQKGARALIESPALVARVDYAPRTLLTGATIGASAYRGNSGNNAVRTVNGVATEIDAATTILEAHAQYRGAGLDLRALYATASIDDVTDLNAARNFSGNASVGEELNGWYAQAGYDVLRFTTSTQELMPYVRYEKVNTQAAVPSGFSVNPANDRTILSVGAQWKPITNIGLKADYQIHRNEAQTGVNQFNVALGYLF